MRYRLFPSLAVFAEEGLDVRERGRLDDNLVGVEDVVHVQVRDIRLNNALNVARALGDIFVRIFRNNVRLLRSTNTPRHQRLVERVRARRGNVAEMSSTTIMSQAADCNAVAIAKRRSFLFILMVQSRGFGPKDTPPPGLSGVREEPARALPVPFCLKGFLPPPRTSLFVSVLAVPYDCHVSSVIDSQSHTTRTTPSFAPSSPPSGSRA